MWCAVDIFAQLKSFKAVTLSGDASKAFQASSAITSVNDVPRQQFRKELISVDTWVKDDGDGRSTINVTDAMIDHWVDCFARMARAGQSVPIPASHEDVGDSDKNRGFVKSLYKDRGALFMTCELIGSDALEAASRNDVSIGVSELFVDGRGNEYQFPIDHVALTPTPVIPGLGDFIPIAASKKRKGLSMSFDWKVLQTRLGITESLTDDNALEVLAKAFNKPSEMILSRVQKAIGATAALSAEKLTDVLANFITVTKKNAADDAVAGSSVTTDPELVKMGKRLVTMSFDQLKKDHVLTAPVVEALKDHFLSNEALTLAFKNGRGTDDVETLVKILSKNDSVVLSKERTAAQTLSALPNPIGAEHKGPSLGDLSDVRVKELRESGTPVATAESGGI